MGNGNITRVKKQPTIDIKSHKDSRTKRIFLINLKLTSLIKNLN